MRFSFLIKLYNELILAKIKGATTEVIAPKNANSDLSLNKLDIGIFALAILISGRICVFTKVLLI